MSSINRVRKLQVLYFSRKNKEIKNLKNGEKFLALNSHLYILLKPVLPEKRHKKWNQECKEKQSRMFNFCNIFNLLTSRTQKIAWWSPVFKPDFHIFPYDEQSRKI